MIHQENNYLLNLVPFKAFKEYIMINIKVDYFTVRNTKPLQQKVKPSLTLLSMVTSLKRSVRRNQGLQNTRLIAKPLNIKQMKQNKGV